MKEDENGGTCNMHEGNKLIDSWMEGQKDRCMDGYIARQTSGRTDR
jgi:hypothetical protein